VRLAPSDYPCYITSRGFGGIVALVLTVSWLFYREASEASSCQADGPSAVARLPQKSCRRQQHDTPQPIHHTHTNMLCAISGEAPREAVASRKSGNVFEKRLIEAHIAENHTDPVTGEELAVEDLIELKSPQVVTPRAPNLTSIPALLSAFQNEWDAIVLETHTLKQQLAQTRQELSTALYQNDAATRVIARMSRERDEAREALSNVTISGGGGSNGDAMQVDGQALPEELVARVDETQAQYVHALHFLGTTANNGTGFSQRAGSAPCPAAGSAATSCRPSTQHPPANHSTPAAAKLCSTSRAS
jgi:hypothetical protein